VGYRLRMSGEIRDWPADLRDSDPEAARQVGEALTALMSEGSSLKPPLIVSLEASPPGQADTPGALEEPGQDRLEQAQAMRRHHAEAAALVKDIEQQVAELEARAAQLSDQRWRALQEGRPEAAAEAVDELATVQSQLAELRRLLPGTTEAEQKLRQQDRQNQARLDAFRARKETLKASHLVAQADSQSPEAATESRLREITAEIERELRPPASLEGLMELRPGTPGDGDIRIMFAVEPPGIALLIAVLEGHDAVQEQRSEAARLSAEVLRRARAGQAPEAMEHAFDDVPSFLDEFFPGSAEAVETGAAALAAGNRGRALAMQRTRLGLTREQVAQRMGVRPQRVSAIESAEPGATEIRALAAYVEALGGRLEIIADFGEERVVLR
jgi:hypothetical protein